MNNKTYYVSILANKDLITEIEIENLRIKRKKLFSVWIPTVVFPDKIGT